MSHAEHDRRIDYIEFGATEIGEIKRFYGEAFGWPFTDWGPDYASFADGRISGGFWTEREPGVGPLVVLYATDLEATRDRVAAAGGAITRPIFAFPGGRRFHFADPSGNELAVWSE